MDVLPIENVFFFNLDYYVYMYLYTIVNIVAEGNANSGSSDDQSGSDIENDFKNSTNKLGEEICVTDLLEKAKMKEFKVFIII